MCHVLIIADGQAVDGAKNHKEITEEIGKQPCVKKVYLDHPIDTCMNQFMVEVSENEEDIAAAIKEIEESGEVIEDHKNFDIREWIVEKIRNIIREFSVQEAVFDIRVLEAIPTPKDE